ncbi:MAG: serine/threonine protein kinase [Planctomycetes bacterium]|nr:serine/threonine protein kinase [Planctomycetota bacterium]
MTDEGSVFILESELGRGGMGVVYQARDERLGRPVAIKIGIARDTEKRLRRFQREGEIAASLEHPGIVRVHSAGVISGRPYLCFELVANARTLAEQLQFLPVEARLLLVAELAEALGFAHARGVVHRDVKPENVLIDDGHARLTDFGVARAEDLERMTRTGTTLGTPYYAAPEQLLDGHRVGPQADVWSLGVILYEALTGELPFQGESLIALVASISTGKFRPPKDMNDSVSPGVEAVCLAALRVDPEGRYASGTEFADDLGRALRGEATQAQERGSSLPQVLVVLLGVLALVALGLVAAIASRLPSSSPSPSGQTSPSQSVAEGGNVALAKEALAAGAPARALRALGDAPSEDPEAIALRVRALLDLQRGSEALPFLRALSASPQRSSRVLEAVAHGAELEAGEALLEGVGAGVEDPAVLRWRLLELASRPAPFRELKQAFNRARRGGADLGGLGAFVSLHQDLAGLGWQHEALWSLAEKSQINPKLAGVRKVFELALRLPFAVPAERAVCLRGLQRWLLPRIRYALNNVTEREWKQLVEAGAGLGPSLERDELRLLQVVGRNYSFPLLPGPLTPAERAVVELPPARFARLPARARCALLACRVTRGATLETPALDRRRWITEMSQLLPPVRADGAPWTLVGAQTQEVEFVKTAILVEATRWWEMAWRVGGGEACEAYLRRSEAFLTEAEEFLPAGGLGGDWRYRIARFRNAALRGQVQTMLELVQGGWSDQRHTQHKSVLTIEAHLQAGDFASARDEVGVLEREGVPAAWKPQLHNQLIFLESPPRGTPLPTKEVGHPLPWWSEENTKRLLEAKWRPGQPILPALGR